MARITIYDLHTTDGKKLIFNLNNMELTSIFGGEYDDAYQVLKYGAKALEFVFAIYAIDTILLLTQAFKK